MKVSWLNDDEERVRGDAVGTTALPDPDDHWASYVLVRGEDGKMYQVPIDRFVP